MSTVDIRWLRIAEVPEHASGAGWPPGRGPACAGVDELGRDRRAGQRDVAEAELRHPLRIQAVAAIEHERVAHEAHELAPVELEVLRPFGGQHDGIAVVEDLL